MGREAAEMGGFKREIDLGDRELTPGEPPRPPEAAKPPTVDKMVRAAAREAARAQIATMMGFDWRADAGGEDEARKANRIRQEIERLRGESEEIRLSAAGRRDLEAMNREERTREEQRRAIQEPPPRCPHGLNPTACLECYRVATAQPAMPWDLYWRGVSVPAWSPAPEELAKYPMGGYPAPKDGTTVRTTDVVTGKSTTKVWSSVLGLWVVS